MAAVTAQAQPETLTLASKGTINPPIDETVFGVSMGIIVNFTARTVQGFDVPGSITIVDDVMVSFAGRREVLTSISSIEDRLYRLTGDGVADVTLFDRKTNKIIGKTTYALQCRDTKRIF